MDEILSYLMFSVGKDGLLISTTIRIQAYTIFINNTLTQGGTFNSISRLSKFDYTTGMAMSFLKFGESKKPIRERETVQPPEWFKRYAVTGTDLPALLFLKYVELSSVEEKPSLEPLEEGTRNTVYGIAMEVDFKDIKKLRNKLEDVSGEINDSCIDIEEEKYLDLAEPDQIGASEGVLSRLRSLKKYSALTQLGVSPYAMRILEIGGVTSLAVICAVDEDVKNPLIFVLSPNNKSLTSSLKLKSKKASWQTPFGFWRTLN